MKEKSETQNSNETNSHSKSEMLGAAAAACKRVGRAKTKKQVAERMKTVIDILGKISASSDESEKQ